MSLRPRPLRSQEGCQEGERGQGRAFVETSSAYLRRGVYSDALYSHTPRARELGEGLLEEEDLGDLVPFEEMLKD
jgi:hypothetical protein